MLCNHSIWTKIKEGYRDSVDRLDIFLKEELWVFGYTSEVSKTANGKFQVAASKRALLMNIFFDEVLYAIWNLNAKW